MEQELITSVRFLGALPMFVAVACLMLINRGKLQSAVYNRSRQFIAAATLLLGIQFTIQFFGHLREQSVTLCWTLNMMAYVIATPLYNMAELNLLRAGHNMKQRYWRNGIFIAICYAIFAIGYFTDTLINDEKPFMTTTFIVAALYFVKLLELSWVLSKDMKVAYTHLTDEELSERHDALRFTARVMKLIIFFSLFSPWAGMSSSLMLNSFYGIIIFPLLLIFIGMFLFYGWNMAECIKVDDEIAKGVMTETDTQNEQIRQRIEQWVSERHFTDPNVTIGGALSDMGISSTALNYYLEQHTTVGRSGSARFTQVKNYRQWLPYLRIEEAKRIMLEHPEYSFETIAESCGYSNKSNFSRAFKAHEGITPGQWLSAQSENAD